MRLSSAKEGAAGTFLAIWKPREPLKKKKTTRNKVKKRDGVGFGGLARRKELGWSRLCKLRGRGGEKAATSN